VLDGAAAGVAGWLPQPASVTGTTAMASATPAAVVRADFMAASSARHGEAGGLAACHDRPAS
jgi:hypothetical protein